MPCASIASTVQLYITLPSTITVHAPQVPRSQTRFAAVRSSRCRSVSHSVDPRLNVHLVRLAVDLEGDGHFARSDHVRGRGFGLRLLFQKSCS